MKKAERIRFSREGPFSEICSLSTMIGTAEYFGITGRAEMHDAVLEKLFKGETSDDKENREREEKE